MNKKRHGRVKSALDAGGGRNGGRMTLTITEIVRGKKEMALR